MSIWLVDGLLFVGFVFWRCNSFFLSDQYSDLRNDHKHFRKNLFGMREYGKEESKSGSIHKYKERKIGHQMITTYQLFTVFLTASGALYFERSIETTDSYESPGARNTSHGGGT